MLYCDHLYGLWEGHTRIISCNYSFFLESVAGISFPLREIVLVLRIVCRSGARNREKGNLVGHFVKGTRVNVFGPKNKYLETWKHRNYLSKILLGFVFYFHVVLGL